MAGKIAHELEKLERKKEKIKLKEKILKEKEQQKKAKRFPIIGKLASKAGIDSLDDEVLLGAFLEIKDHSKNADQLKSWKEKVSTFIDKNKSTKDTPLCISFQNQPTPEEREKMRTLDFKWNSFRKEFYGYGNKDILESELHGSNFKIEVMN